MNGDFFLTIERLELISFFAAYPLLYLFINFLGDSFKSQSRIINRLKLLLPYAYALTGLAFIAYQLYNLYPNLSFQQIKDSTQLPVLKIWAFISILFFVPLFAKKTALSLLHSFVFFFLLLQDLYYQLSGKNEMLYTIKNDMKVYTDSFLLQTSSLIILFIILSIIKKVRSKKQPL